MMAKGSNLSRRRGERVRRENQVTTRILLVFLFAFLSIAGLVAVNSFYQPVGANIGRLLATRRVLFVVSGVFAAAFLGLSVSALIQLNRPEVARVLGGFALPTALLSLSCLILALYMQTGVRFLYAVLPAAAILYLVFYTYQREFFFIAKLTAFGALALWFVREQAPGGAGRWVVFTAVLVISAVSAVLLLFLSRRSGLLTFGKTRVRIFPPDTRYALMYVDCGVIALSAILAVLLGNLAAFYLVFILVGLLLVAAVYYTVKLM